MHAELRTPNPSPSPSPSTSAFTWASDRPRPVTVVAAVSLVAAGVSLAVYALTAFTSRDWTVAGPGVLVAVAGIAGLRNRWFHLAGLVPIGAVLTVAGPILAFDLARPEQTAYFVGTALIIVSACAAAIFGTASTIEDRRTLPIALVASLVVTPLVIMAVVSANPASADASDGLVDADRVNALDVQMIDVAFVVDPTDLQPGTVVHLRNTGTLPHDFTIPDLDVAVFVPSGRDTYVRLPDSPAGSFELICTVGDHREQGMRLSVTPG